MKHITTYILAMGIGLAGLTSCSSFTHPAATPHVICCTPPRSAA